MSGFSTKEGLLSEVGGTTGNLSSDSSPGNSPPKASAVRPGLTRVKAEVVKGKTEVRLYKSGGGLVDKHLPVPDKRAELPIVGSEAVMPPEEVAKVLAATFKLFSDAMEKGGELSNDQKAGIIDSIFLDLALNSTSNQRSGSTKIGTASTGVVVNFSEFMNICSPYGGIRRFGRAVSTQIGSTIEYYLLAGSEPGASAELVNIRNRLVKNGKDAGMPNDIRFATDVAPFDDHCIGAARGLVARNKRAVLASSVDRTAEVLNGLKGVDFEGDGDH